MQDFIEAMKEVSPTGAKAQEYQDFQRKNKRTRTRSQGKEADHPSISLSELFSLWSNLTESSSSLEQREDTTKRKGKIVEVAEEDEEEEEKANNAQERIKQWSKRFEGDKGEVLLKEMCKVYSVDQSLPRDQAMQTLANHVLDW